MNKIITIELLREQKRYSNKPIRISKQEVEYLVGYSFEDIKEDIISGYCQNCDEFEDIILAPNYNLIVDSLGIRFEGICNKCKKDNSILLGIHNRMEYIFKLLN